MCNDLQVYSIFCEQGTNSRTNFLHKIADTSK